MGKKITSIVDVVNGFDELREKSDDFFTVIGCDAKLKIRAITELPIAYWMDTKESRFSLVDSLRKIASQTGSPRLFSRVPDRPDFREQYYHAFEQNLFTDILLVTGIPISESPYQKDQFQWSYSEKFNFKGLFDKEKNIVQEEDSIIEGMSGDVVARLNSVGTAVSKSVGVPRGKEPIQPATGSIIATSKNYVTPSAKKDNLLESEIMNSPMKIATILEDVSTTRESALRVIRTTEDFNELLRAFSDYCQIQALDKTSLKTKAKKSRLDYQDNGISGSK